MSFLNKRLPIWLAAGAVSLGFLSPPMTTHAQRWGPEHAPAGPVEAQFRGCQAAGWCVFWFEWPHPFADVLHRVRPDGVSGKSADDALSIAIRDRLNALLASMIHQSKRIVLHNLRELDDGTYAASVTVNGVNVASDPTLAELHEKVSSTTRQ